MEIFIVILYIILFSVTSLFLLIYLRRLKEIALEYERAKKILDDIIFSFNKDIQRQGERIQEIAKNYEDLSLKRMKEIEEINSTILDIKGKLENLSGYKEVSSIELTNLKNKIDDLIAKYNEILEKIGEIEKTIREREMEYRKEVKKEEEIKSSTLIGENVTLASLTETELKVLEILAKEGEKTVSEIKDRIKLTREHTARLMKSLYTRGFVERRDDKIPFVYRLNREMEEILKNLKSNP